MTGHGIAGSSVGNAMAAAHRAGGAEGAHLLHATAADFVAGADHGVIAAALITLTGAFIAFFALRKPAPRRAEHV
jgi:hypothetical protein